MEVFETVNGRLRGHIPTEETVSLRRALDAKYLGHIEKEGSIPHADKFYLNIDRESLLEYNAWCPNLVIATVQLICEGNLLAVPRGEQAHL
jgi:hypothetical protein